MPTFRKKPVEIEAWQFNGEDRPDWPDWVKGHDGSAIRYGDNLEPERITIETLEGTMTASTGDWIIKGTAGELYPCKPAIFAEIYEPVLIGKTELGGGEDA